MPSRPRCDIASKFDWRLSYLDELAQCGLTPSPHRAFPPPIPDAALKTDPNYKLPAVRTGTGVAEFVRVEIRQEKRFMECLSPTIDGKALNGFYSRMREL